MIRFVVTYYTAWTSLIINTISVPINIVLFKWCTIIILCVTVTWYTNNTFTNNYIVCLYTVIHVCIIIKNINNTTRWAKTFVFKHLSLTYSMRGLEHYNYRFRVDYVKINTRKKTKKGWKLRILYIIVCAYHSPIPTNLIITMLLSL